MTPGRAAKRSCRITGIPEENLLCGGDQGRRLGRQTLSDRI